MHLSDEPVIAAETAICLLLLVRLPNTFYSPPVVNSVPRAQLEEKYIKLAPLNWEEGRKVFKWLTISWALFTQLKNIVP